MSKYPTFFFLLFLFALFAPRAALLAPTSETTNGESPFRGDRRPGILAAPTEEPTGQNALLYRRMGKLRPDELLDLLSENPSE